MHGSCQVVEEAAKRKWQVTAHIAGEAGMGRELFRPTTGERSPLDENEMVACCEPAKDKLTSVGGKIVYKAK